MIKVKPTYTPIDCDLYDYLEVWAMQKTIVNITYSVENDENIQTVISQIMTTKTKDKEEFIILKSGAEIRLDRIIKIDQVNFSEGTGCTLFTD
jgi:Rho-binding antiterminator